MESRLWDYIDGQSDLGEKAAVEQLIATNPEWSEKFRELVDIHQLAGYLSLENPPMRFGKAVMEQISGLSVARASRSYINKGVIRGIMAFFMVMILGLLIWGLAGIDWTQKVPEKDISRFNPVNISWDRIFSHSNVQIFILLDVMLGLMLLDMYLRRARRRDADHIRS